ncbi:hypothetical protein [Aquisalimonas sp.]|uniref:hypothetical protein n=1 Tax=unclassified Aquisalimonas TaxID=2644645 RepID=UPI0025C02502|nr:hypothetical protein [Aquisalimonas sp.]
MLGRAVRALVVVVLVGVLVGVALFGGQRYLENRVAAAVDRLLDDLPAYLDGSYAAVTVNPFDRTAAVHDLRLEGTGLFPDVRVRRVSIANYSGGTVLPESLDLRLHDVHWERGGWPQTLEAVENALNGPVVGDIALAMTFQPDSRRLEIDSLAVALHSGDAIEVRGRFLLGDRGLLDHPYDGPASGLELLEFDGRWRDTGLLHSLIDRLAREQGMTGPTLSANVLGELEWAVAEWDDPRLDAGMDALRAFFREPGLLHLRIAPGDPVNLVLLGERFLVDPPAALQRLGPELRYTAVSPDAEGTLTAID